ncbi:S-adenosyl-L-methionine-dependent methyltransferase [Pholiota conissans]|uniref:tRNA (cytosine(38)-C(5))-methyltransferase n=1 Tax=Pholiota conissans TaxID=109636 RepID=A0A9P6CZN7_9AGAR|nr:S-adenosyl-L-methionine-dependent methyltransferase [Pholiota conissans]
MTIKALEFYSGIGGLHLALSRSKLAVDVVQAFDWDQTACLVYSANHGRGIAKKVDISTLTAPTLSSYNANLWLLSPACQPYTVLNPNAKGAQDPRALSFLHLVQNVLPELAVSNQHPDRLLVENVAGFEDSSTRKILVDTLRSIGYTTLEHLLTPLQFGIPNSRLRYYLLAKKDPFGSTNISEGKTNSIWRQIPGQGIAWSDPRLDEESQAGRSMVDEIKTYLDDDRGEEHYQRYRIPDKVLEKWGRLFDIVKPSGKRSCCFTRGYTQLVERAGSIIQENEALDTTSTFDAFLHAQSLGERDAIHLLHPLKLRYFAPSELLRIFAFDHMSSTSSRSKEKADNRENAEFIWPETVSTKSKYKLIGNSVNVLVVQKLIEYLFDEPGC